MNILIDKLPTEYKGLKINTNFRSFILFELLMQDNEISKEDRIYMSLNLFYKEPITDIKIAIDGILWFYTMGENKNKTKQKSIKQTTKQIYSYEHDAKYIYSAFYNQYKIDLNEIEYLHWFKFKSLFDSLTDDNKICEIMSYRAIDLNKIKDKDEKNKYKRLKKLWALPDNRTEEEKERDFANSFW